ncbi:LCP family protein [Herbihabitans rhizosphaerae]|uniref:LCP family protein n=1 Tax=Herbihabitans rhizosphaerae TaxID=1872711 RepID=UPI001F5ED57E|nr:LCP family protein [Herbihabitans rhizosphaerae]
MSDEETPPDRPSPKPRGETVVFGTAASRTVSDGDAGEPEREPAKTKPEGPSRGLVFARVMVALLSAAALVATGAAWAGVDWFQGKVNTTDVLADAHNAPGAPPAEDGANDILVVGNDTRTDMQGNPLSLEILKQLRTEMSGGINTDTIILLRIPHNGGKSYAMSFPRDTYLDIPGYREDKINAAYGVTKTRVAQQLGDKGERNQAKIEQESDKAGRSVLVQTVQNLTGVRVDHYAEISLYGFYLLSEAIGGVEVCLKHATSDPDSGADFRAGRQRVAGGAALSYVRQRALPRGDLDRIVRQQTFLSSAMQQVLSSGTLTNGGKLGALADALNKSVVTDPGLKILELVGQASAISSGNVDFVTIPVTDINARNDRGQSIVTVDKDAVRRFAASLVSGGPVAKPTIPVHGAPPPRTTTTKPTPTTTRPTSRTTTTTRRPTTETPPGFTGDGLLELNRLAAQPAPPCVD